MYYKVLIIVSALSFVFYSVNSIFSKRMISEYDRWGFGRLRILIAVLQMFGGIGLLLGINNLVLLCFVSFFLMLMMVFAIAVRIKIKDSFINALPAILYTILNFSIFYIAFLNINN